MQQQQQLPQTHQVISYHRPSDQYSDEDRLSIESSVFEEPRSSDPIIALSNRSSSESNKSQTTIDTGYMSASNDTDRIFFGASEDFRGRLSSVDTSSSIESCASNDMHVLQNGIARYVKSPLTGVLRRDDIHEDRYYKPSSIRSNSRNLRMPMNARNMSCKPMPPNQHRAAAPQRRPIIQPQCSVDGARVPYSGTMFGAFQTGLAKITSAAATTSEVVMGRRSFKKATQFAQAKFRKGSKESCDSLTLNSSPGYLTKTVDQPLALNNTDASANQTSCLNRAVNSPITPKIQFNVARTALRQDSTISNDSYSITSSPGYNTKLEQPLIAHSAKRFISKCLEEKFMSIIY